MPRSQHEDRPDPADGSTPVLDVRGLTVRYGTNHALSDLSLEIGAGRTLAVLGSNGAGKTSLMRAITGTLGFHGGEADPGAIRLFGAPTPSSSEPATISRRGVALVPEGRRVFKEMTVEENLVAGALSLARGRSRKETLEEIYQHFPILADRRAQSAALLSGGEQQIMAIGRAMMSAPRLLLVDEPSLGLAPVMIDRIAEVLAGIQQRGTTILLAEQNPSIALDLADRVVVLRVGTAIRDAAPDELGGVEALRDLYLGVDTAPPLFTPKRSAPAPSRLRSVPAPDGDKAPVLRVAGVGVRFAGLTALEDISFDVPQGSVFAVIGPNGAGKSTLFNVISGFYRATTGTVRHGDHELTAMRPHRIARLGISRTFQNLELSDENTVLENILLGCHLTSRAGVVSTALRLPSARHEQRALVERCREMADVVGLADRLDEQCSALSYGLRKRVEIARALVGRPKVLLLDEPVAGMTADEITEMQQVILRAHDELDLTLLLIEHDIEFTLGLADEVAVLDFGRMIARGAPSDIRQDQAVHSAYLGSQAAATAAGLEPAPVALDHGASR